MVRVGEAKAVDKAVEKVAVTAAAATAAAATTAGTASVPPQEGMVARKAAMAVAVEMAVAREVVAREAEARAPVALAMSYPRH